MQEKRNISPRARKKCLKIYTLFKITESFSQGFKDILTQYQRQQQTFRQVDLIKLSDFSGTMLVVMMVMMLVVMMLVVMMVMMVLMLVMIRVVIVVGMSMIMVMMIIIMMMMVVVEIW